MKRLSFSYRTHIDFQLPVTEHYFNLRCLPNSSAQQQVISASLELEPAVRWAMQQDGFGNLLQTGCCREGHSCFGYWATGQVVIDRSKADLAPCNPAFGCASPYTIPGPSLKEFFQREGCGSRSPQELMELVHRHFTYTPGSTSVSTTAEEAFALGKGVCQDEAHSLIALCRMAGIPARYAYGLTVGEGATHAWVEVYHPQTGWKGLDPTRGCLVDDSYLTVARGRDYGDCPVERGVFRGNTGQLQTVFMQVTEQ